MLATQPHAKVQLPFGFPVLNHSHPVFLQCIVQIVSKVMVKKGFAKQMGARKRANDKSLLCKGKSLRSNGKGTEMHALHIRSGPANCSLHRQKKKKVNQIPFQIVAIPRKMCKILAKGMTTL